MDPRSFDTLARSLARPRSRRGLIGAALALGAGALARNSADALSVCPPGQTPNRKGDCSCPPGTDACPDGCFNLRTDTANCGECGQGCIGGICKKGECLCPSGSILCDSGPARVCCPTQSGCNPDGTCACIPDGETCSTVTGTCEFCCGGALCGASEINCVCT